MKHLILFLILLPLVAKGQALGDIKDYLASPQIPGIAKQYYQGKFRGSYDDSTAGIIDSLHTKNNFTRPFYLLLASKMIVQSDGALSEVLFLECEELFESKPDAVIEFLYCGNKLVKSSFRKNWAGAVVDEITISHEKQEKQYLQVMKKSALKKCNYRNKEKLSAFYSEIYRQLSLALRNSQ